MKRLFFIIGMLIQLNCLSAVHDMSINEIMETIIQDFKEQKHHRVLFDEYTLQSLKDLKKSSFAKNFSLSTKHGIRKIITYLNHRKEIKKNSNFFLYFYGKNDSTSSRMQKVLFYTLGISVLSAVSYQASRDAHEWIVAQSFYDILNDVKNKNLRYKNNILGIQQSSNNIAQPAAGAEISSEAEKFLKEIDESEKKMIIETENNIYQSRKTGVAVGIVGIMSGMGAIALTHDFYNNCIHPFVILTYDEYALKDILTPSCYNTFLSLLKSH